MARAYFEQILETTADKIAAVIPQISLLINYLRQTRRARFCGWSKDEHLGEVHLWTPTDRPVSYGWLAKYFTSVRTLDAA